MTGIQEEKKSFVENELKALVLKAKPHFSDVSYTFDDAAQNEYVIVTADNNYTYKVNVTGNTLMAIAEEVIKLIVCK